MNIIETNIRSVFIHYFFKDKKSVRDKEILPLIEKTLYAKNPRKWYYALMDYGVMLKRTHENPSRKSLHHKAQSPFKTSDRKVRGLILKAIVTHGSLSKKILSTQIKESSERLQKNLIALVKEQNPNSK